MVCGDRAKFPKESQAGVDIVSLKCEGEELMESHRAHLVVGYEPLN